MNGAVRSFDDTATAASAPQQRENIAMPLYTSSRNVSGPFAVDTAVAPDSNSAISPWQRTNPHTAHQNSKTSQYIEKVTAENERLRRELKAERLAREEEGKRIAAARAMTEAAEAKHQQYQLERETNERAIERKDRKLEELKAAVDLEAKRRMVAEQRADEALRMLGDTRSETQRQLASAYEMKRRAEASYDAARDGFKRITDSYEKKLKSINDELNQLRKDRLDDADKIKRQAIVGDQLQHQVEVALRNRSRMTNMMGAYKEEHRKEINALVQEAEGLRMAVPHKEREATKLVDDLTQTRDKMKWVMTQHKRQQDGE
ncbi:hypothetical protein CC78DRAFT_528252 [Lojkania enalia]|uniref:SWI5-dependent HO expression protein 3 n=1 Tax=Lojkania enalia TaxID=147567 RepID=A0A9P4NC30_9PLEO|nr:hypothetical protein CC78DRAFT_528252 [Didymosphaeria enalia]